MKFVHLTSELSVAPDQVASVEVDTYGRGVHVALKTGEKKWVDNRYGQSSYETKRKLIEEIEEAYDVEA